ncbi:hypothetical protein ACP70R_038289 [Stipagrostis hirtigluma subsp. patula]
MEVAMEMTVHVSRRLILGEVLRGIGGSEAAFHYAVGSGGVVARAFALVPNGGVGDDSVTLVDAAGVACATEAAAADSAADALLFVLRRDLGVAVDDVNHGSLVAERQQQEELRDVAAALERGWDRSLGHLEELQASFEEICMDAVDDCPQSIICSHARGAAVWADEQVLEGLRVHADLKRRLF